MADTTTNLTKDAVLAALRRFKTGATSDVLAEKLKAHPRAVRRHLTTLHEEKAVTRVFEYDGRPPVGRYRYVVDSKVS